MQAVKNTELSWMDFKPTTIGFLGQLNYYLPTEILLQPTGLVTNPSQDKEDFYIRNFHSFYS